MTALRPDVHRARTTIVIESRGALAQKQPAGEDAAATMAELARSNIVAASVVRNLRLDVSPSGLLERVAVHRRHGALLVVEVDERDAARAQREAQELALVFSQLVHDRYAERKDGAGNQALRATVFDPAHVLSGRVAPHPVRNGLFGALLGLVLGLGALRPRPLREAVRRVRLPRLSLPAPAPPLSAPGPEPAPEPEPEPTPEAEPELMPEPEPEPQPARPATPGVLEPRTGVWSLPALEAAVARHRGEQPGSSGEWEAYLLFLRDHADVDGFLPQSFDALVLDVFADLIARERG